MIGSPMNRTNRKSSTPAPRLGVPPGLESTLMVTVEDVEDALTNVIDPELGLDFVELGLIYGIEVDDGHVHVTFSLTTPACPIGPQVSEQTDEVVSDLEGVNSVGAPMTF